MLIRRFLFLLSFFASISLQAQVQLQTSNLPILVITTENGVEIPNEPKIAAHLGIIWNGDGVTNHITDPFNDYDGKAGIEIRGSSSQWFDKKNYALETWNPDSTSNNVSLLGLPKENDWVLHGPFSDKSLLRNAMAYTLAGWIMEYAPRVRFCEVVINDNYKGVYILTEKIKRDKNRVNISELTPDVTAGDDLTGGYILKFDKWDGAFSDGFPSLYPPYPGANGQVYYQYHYPAPDEITPQQKSYIKNYVDLMEYTMKSSYFADSLEGYPKFFDVPTLRQFIFIQEIGRNVDGYRLSTFMYKDKDSKDSRLKLGPIWDFNLAFGNVDYCIGPGTYGWGIHFNDFCPSDSWSIQFWWLRLWDEPGFQKDLGKNWRDLRATTLSNERVFHLLDSLANMLQVPAQRNFQRWPILNQYIWPNAFVGGSYQAEVNYLRTWLTDRLAWMDEQWKENTSDTLTPDPDGKSLKVFPNPSNAGVNFELLAPTSTTVRIEIYNVQGQLTGLLTENTGGKAGWRKIVWKEVVPAGMYFYRIKFNEKDFAKGKLVKY